MGTLADVAWNAEGDRVASIRATFVRDILYDIKYADVDVCLLE